MSEAGSELQDSNYCPCACPVAVTPTPDGTVTSSRNDTLRQGFSTAIRSFRFRAQFAVESQVTRFGARARDGADHLRPNSQPSRAHVAHLFPPAPHRLHHHVPFPPRSHRDARSRRDSPKKIAQPRRKPPNPTVASAHGTPPGPGTRSSSLQLTRAREPLKFFQFKLARANSPHARTGTRTAHPPFPTLRLRATPSRSQAKRPQPQPQPQGSGR